MYIHLLLLTCVPPLSFSQAWRDLTRQGESRAGDADVEQIDFIAAQKQPVLLQYIKVQTRAKCAWEPQCHTSW